MRISDWISDVCSSDLLSLLGGARYTDSRNDFTGCMRGAPGIRFTFWKLSQLISGVAPPAPDASTWVNLDQNPFLLIRTPAESRLHEHNFYLRLGANYHPPRHQNGTPQVWARICPHKE